MMRLSFSFPVGRPGAAVLRPLRAVRSRRGIAMVLVLIALGTGTILSAAALTSRDNSAAIGQNAGAMARASWVAEAGVNFAVAVLETNNDWRSVRNGVILSAYPLVGGAVDAVVTNLQGDPPADTDRELILIATATVDGVTGSTERRVSLMLPRSVFQPVDPFISEFAIFTEEALTIDDGAQVRVFSLSPDADTLASIRIGTGFSGAGDLDIDPDARLRGVSLVLDIDASASLESAANALAVVQETQRVPLDIPALPMVLPGAFGALPVMTTQDLTVQEGLGHNRWGINGSEATIDEGEGGPLGAVIPDITALPLGFGIGAGFPAHLIPLMLLADSGTGGGGGGDGIFSSSTTLPGWGVYQNIQITDSAELIVDAANGRLYEFDDLIIDSDGVLVIKGRIVLHVGGNVLITRGGTIELADAQSSLVLFVGQDVLVSDGGMGVSRIIGRDRSRSFRKLMTYSNPRRMRIIALPEGAGGSEEPEWEFTNNAMVLGTIHAPHADLDINTASTVIGQVVVGTLRLRRDTALLYDPRLDSRSGFSLDLGPMYANHQPHSDVVSEIALADPRLGALALFQRINGHVSDQWTTSESWSIRTTDPTVTDPNSYYDGFKTYSTTSGSRAQAILPSGAFTGGGNPTTIIPDAIAPPASARPTHRTHGRVVVAPVARAVRILEGR